MTDIAVALGGGGVKGYAHVGVLRALERAGFRIRAIAGTSIGGLIGAIYAVGRTPGECEDRLCALDQSKLFGRGPGEGPSMLGLSGVIDLLQEALGDCTFDQLKLPVAVTAVDLDTAELLALQRGRVLDAVLATIAVPGIFPPKEWQGRRLIDGGILDPVPVSLARWLAPDLPVVAVVLSPPVEEWIRPTPPRLLASLPFLTSYLGRLRIAQALNIFLRSIDIAGAELTELRLQVDRADVVIRPAVPHIGFLDDVDISGVVALGDEAVEQALPELRRAMSWRGRLARAGNRRKTPRTVLSWETDCE